MAKIPQAPPSFNDTSKSVLEDTRRLNERARAVRKAVLEAVTPATATFHNTLLPILQDENLRLAEQTRLEFLQNVSTDADIRQASREASDIFDRFRADDATNLDLYGLVLAAAGRKEILDAESQRALEKQLFLLGRNGCSLPEDKRKRLRQIRQEVGRIATEFEQNVRKADLRIYVPEDYLTGVPARIIYQMEQGTGLNAGARLVTLSTCGQIVAHAKNSDVRRKLSIASASVYEANVQLMEKVIVLRDEAARMLGYRHHAEYILEDRMETSCESINGFLDDLSLRLGARGKMELERLKELKKDEEHGLDNPEATKFYTWDYPYYSRLMQEQDFAVDQGEIVEYFPLEVVIDRMLDLMGHIFGMRFKAITEENSRKFFPERSFESLVWHSDVRMYTVWDRNESGDFLAYMYMDLYPRDGKYGHLQAAAVLPGFTNTDSTRHYPATTVLANFPAPTETKPCLLKHMEIWLLFHITGHTIHDLVSKTKYARFHGPVTSQDFNSSPSQMMEFWCWDISILQRISQHYSSLSPVYLETWKNEQQLKGQDLVEAPPKEIPEDLAARLIEAREAGRALFYLDSIHKSIFDMQIYQPQSAEEARSIDTTLLWNRLRKDIVGLDGLDTTPGQANFHPIVGSGGAGYYGYAQVYAADQFYTAFKDDLVNAEQGARYRREVLEKGGSVDGMTMLMRFLARKPSSEAFYKYFGLEPAD